MDRNTVLYWGQTAGASLMAFWGGFALVFQILAVAMAVDILTGIGASIVNSKLDPNISMRGITRKAMIWCTVWFAEWLGQAVPIVLSNGTQLYLPLGQAVAIFYIGHEGLSILNNLAWSGITEPGFLRKLLERFVAYKGVSEPKNEVREPSP